MYLIQTQSGFVNNYQHFVHWRDSEYRFLPRHEHCWLWRLHSRIILGLCFVFSFPRNCNIVTETFWLYQQWTRSAWNSTRVLHNNEYPQCTTCKVLRASFFIFTLWCQPVITLPLTLTPFFPSPRLPVTKKWIMKSSLPWFVSWRSFEIVNLIIFVCRVVNLPIDHQVVPSKKNNNDQVHN